jgi:UrcA family protein
MTLGKLLIGAAVSAFTLACTAAYADSAQPTGSEQHSSIVRTGDLDLNRPKDVARLYNRIASAADQLCGPRAVGGVNHTSADYASCYADAVSRAVTHIDRPSVTAYFQQHSSDSASHKLTALQ